MGFDGFAYGPVFESLFKEDRLNVLDGGVENEAARSALDSLSVSNAFEGKDIVDREMAESCISALWLYHDFLNDSHTISQGIYSTTGSYWHGIMHRREPDYANAKYWFRKVGEHPVFVSLSGNAKEIARGGGPDTAFLRDQDSWEPYAFIDLVEACLSGSSDQASLCRRIQQSEFELLFDYSYKQAVGA